MEIVNESYKGNRIKCIYLHLEDYDDYFQGIVLIESPTGMNYLIQMGGVAIHDGICKGYKEFLLMKDKEKFETAFVELDDCKKGCWGGDYNDDKERESYAQDIDKFLKEHCNYKNVNDIYFEFDYERIEELQEGWWPVLIYDEIWVETFDEKGESKLHKERGKYDFKKRGYLHFGNCD